jgi:hypothetical protein
MAMPKQSTQPIAPATDETRSPEAKGHRTPDTSSPTPPTDGATWGERFERLHEQVQGRIPETFSPEEIEADITAAREEVRRARRAARGR